MSAEAVGAVLGQLMGDFAGRPGVILTALGLRLGLWDALAAGPATAETVAERAGAAVPYVREWLRSQAAAGYVGYDPAAGTFWLAPGVAAVLGEGPLSGLTAAWRPSSGCGGRAGSLRGRVPDRTGDLVGALPAAHADGMDLITRAVVAPALVADWLPALDGSPSGWPRARPWPTSAAVTGTGHRDGPGVPGVEVHRFRRGRRLGREGPEGSAGRRRRGPRLV